MFGATLKIMGESKMNLITALQGREPLFSLRCADSCGGARFARARIEGRKWEKVGRLERYWAGGKILYSSTITIRERNKKTLGQKREKRDKCGENGCCGKREGQGRLRRVRRVRHA